MAEQAPLMRRFFVGLRWSGEDRYEPRPLERSANCLPADEVAVIEAEECALVDHVLDEAEVLLFCRLFEPMQN